MATSLRVAVLAGGLSFEREISLRSGRRATDALRDAGAEAWLVDAGGDLLDRLEADRPDVAVVALHGAAGEDGTARALLDLLRIPHVGSPAAACRACWDKPTLKAVLARGGVAVPEGVALPRETFTDLGAQRVVGLLLDALPLPLVVKPARGGSALGVSAVREPGDLSPALVTCFGYDDSVVIERAVDGVEVAVSVLDGPEGPRALPAVEVTPQGGLYDYAARYTPGRTEYHVPARIDPATARELQAAAVQAHRLLGLRGLSRVDAFVDRSGAPVVLEVNTAPGMTEVSLLPMALTAAGIDLGTAVRELAVTASRVAGVSNAL